MPTILSISFRPFFILTALIATINPLLWVLSYTGYISLPLKVVDPLFWHGHEMLFGFFGALVAGFILTASANWTSSAPYQGKALFFLILLWVFERCSYFIFDDKNFLIITLNLFFPALAFMLLKKLWNFPKQKYVFMPILLGLTLASFLHSWGYLYSVNYLQISGKEIAIGLIRFIILLIAGRVIPFFSRSRISGIKIETPSWLNPVALLPIALLAFPWPEATPKILHYSILGVAILANIFRQFTWKPFATLKVPILYILHIGMAFINLELILELIGISNPQMHFTQAALHLFTLGGIGVVGIGMMTRVTLGHTGRVIKADFVTGIIYFLIILAAILRFVIPTCFPDLYISNLFMVVSIWTLGYLLFLLKYFKILISPKQIK